jgi:membrane-associated protease RseP (regulator of RpoE activity)
MKPRLTPAFGAMAALAFACHTPGAAADPQVLDLGNGSKVQIKGGEISVHASGDATSELSSSPGGATGASTPSAAGASTPSATGASTSSATSITRTDTGGGSVTTVTTDRNGQRVTRTITVDKDGKVTVSEPGQAPASPASAAHPAPTPAPAGGWLGVHSVPVSDALRAHIDIPEGQGIVLEFVADGGPAEAAGLRANDIVLSLDSVPVKGVEDFRARLGRTRPGQAVTVEYLRKGKAATVTATLGQRPPDAAPGPRVADETGRLLRQRGQANQAVRRGIVIDGSGEARVIENQDPFDLLLNDPNVPESMKAHIRESRDRMREVLPAAPETDDADAGASEASESDAPKPDAPDPQAPAGPPAETTEGPANPGP